MTTAVSEEEIILIGEAARQAEISAHTLRYYERLGLISPVVRGPHGERRYKVSDLEWIAFLKRLRATGMPVREMARFAELRRGGKTTLAERGQLLDEHADRIRRRISELRADLRAIDVKRAVLESRDVLEGR